MREEIREQPMFLFKKGVNKGVNKGVIHNQINNLIFVRSWWQGFGGNDMEASLPFRKSNLRYKI